MMNTRVAKVATALDIGYGQGDDVARLTVSVLRRRVDRPAEVATSVPSVYQLHPEDRLVALAALTLFATHLRPGVRAQDSRVSFAEACATHDVSTQRIESLISAPDLTAAARHARSIVSIISGSNGAFDYGSLAQLLANLSRANGADSSPTQAAQTFIIDYAAAQRRAAKGTPA